MTDEELRKVNSAASLVTWQPANIAVMGGVMSMFAVIMAIVSLTKPGTTLNFTSVAVGVVYLVVFGYCLAASVTFMLCVDTWARPMWRLTSREMERRRKE